MSERTIFPDEFKNKLLKEFESMRGCYEQLVEETEYILRKCFEKSNAKIHSIKPREGKVKTFESFYKKVKRKRILKNQFELIEDIAGIRIIYLYRSDLKKIGDLLLKNLDVIKVDTGRTRTETPFGYSSDHYIVKLSKNCQGPRYDNIRELKCEIQVRTILMDAWASVSHHLDYKKEVDIPSNLRLDFNALAGLFYVADSHFELFREGVSAAREKIMKTIRQGKFNLKQEINFETLQAYLRWKFPERGQKNVLIDSEIVGELANLGYREIKEIDNIVNVVSSHLKEFEKIEFSQKKWEPHWSGDGLLRVVLDLTEDEYFKRHASFINNVPKFEEALDGLEKYVALLKEFRSKLKK